MKRGDDGLADLDRGVFLAGIVKKNEKADQRNTDQDEDGYSVRLDSELGNFSEHRVCSIRSGPSNRAPAALGRVHQLDPLAVDKKVDAGRRQRIADVRPLTATILLASGPADRTSVRRTVDVVGS